MMRITFLGTSAANAFPEAFCGCRNCERARELGGKSLRRRSAALINDDLLIDLGPDIMCAAATLGRPLTGVRYCLQTHPHADHLDTSHFLSRSPEYGVVGAPRLHFYGSASTVRRVAELLERDCEPYSLLDREAGERLNLQIHSIEACHSFTIGRYRVTALEANHDPAAGSLLYAIEGEGRTIFYGTDTGVLPESTWRAFHTHGLRFDAAILDHTYGPEEAGGDHLSARDVIEHAARLRDEGLLADGARILATHIAHEGNPAHPDLARFAERNGYEAAYDGLTV